MKPSSIYRGLKRHGFAGACRKLSSRINAPLSDPDAPLRILLLTNRDSDNVGDQVIEECDIALISTVMKNLGIRNFKISSRAAGIISKRYLATRNPKLLQGAEDAIRESDIVIFGGAPLLNYRYQVFHERTAITVELAHQYGKPVIFSAIGVEGYESERIECQQLKTALNLDCVRQITTRDDFESLSKFIESDSIPIAKVADPAILSNAVFSKFVARHGSQGGGKIGLFVVRSKIFSDNEIDLAEDDLDEFWLRLIELCDESGLPYELITSGHFSDEAYLEHLIKSHGIPQEVCVFNMNTPEMLVERISRYSAILTCRLHPSIIAASLGVPSVSLVWNSKVSFFYDSIGFPERAFTIDDLAADTVFHTLMQARQEGTFLHDDYRTTVYNTLFEGIKAIACPDSAAQPFALSQLYKEIPPFQGTSEQEKQAKLERKFRRSYNKFNQLSMQNKRLKQKTIALRQKLSETK